MLDSVFWAKTQKTVSIETRSSRNESNEVLFYDVSDGFQNIRHVIETNLTPTSLHQKRKEAEFGRKKRKKKKKKHHSSEFFTASM
jgi:7,8-dihydro-6-hydroxymethylpterin-pyrophosphokinase